MITVENVSKQYGSNSVLRGISVQLHEGAIYGLVGANGCGKTPLLRCICGFRGRFCRFRGIASCAGIVERSELVPGAAVVPLAHLFPAFLHTIVDPRKDHVPGKRIPKTVAPVAPLVVFMTAAGVVVRQRHGFKDQKAAHKAHAGKQLFPEVHSSHLPKCVLR